MNKRNRKKTTVKCHMGLIDNLDIHHPEKMFLTALRGCLRTLLDVIYNDQVEMWQKNSDWVRKMKEMW